MKHTKSVFATAAAVLLVGLLGGNAFACSLQPWQHVESSGVIPFGHDSSWLYVIAPADIPRHTTLFTGYAWLYDDGPNTVIVAVTHDGVKDSKQNPDSWHVHNVKLAFNATKGSDACIVSLDHDTTAGLNIFQNVLSVHISDNELTGHLSGKAVAFEIVSDTGCSTKLGVNLS